MVNFYAVFAFTSFLCQTANNCKNGYWHAPVCKVFVQKYSCSIKHPTPVLINAPVPIVFGMLPYPSVTAKCARQVLCIFNLS